MLPEVYPPDLGLACTLRGPPASHRGIYHGRLVAIPVKNLFPSFAAVAMLDVVQSPVAFPPASFSVSSYPDESVPAVARARDLLLLGANLFRTLRHFWYNLNQPPSLA